MKKFFALLTIVTLLYACKPGIPKDVLEPNKMQSILLDMHLVDGYITGFSNQDSAKKIAASYYKAIYKKFDTDSAHYNLSLDYYYKKPALLKQIYDSVSAKLTVLKEETMSAVSSDLEHNFKGIFDASVKDSTQYDPTLSRNYNYRYLVNQKYGNIYKTPSAYNQINIQSTSSPTVSNNESAVPATVDTAATTVTEPALKPKQ